MTHATRPADDDLATIRIPARFCGPSDSGNGGWVCGTLAGYVEDVPAGGSPSGGGPTAGAVTVRLKSPPPLERALHVVPAGEATGGVELRDGTTVVAVAVPARRIPAVDALPRVGHDEAVEAGTRFPGLVEHAYARCYACGTDRDPQEALCLRPGPLTDGAGGWWVTAWTPTEVDLPIVWAALDCPTGWAAGAGERYVLLGTMTAQVDILPEVGEPLVVLSRRTAAQGRKVHSEAVMVRPPGQVLAQSSTTWIALDG